MVDDRPTGDGSHRYYAWRDLVVADGEHRARLLTIVIALGGLVVLTFSIVLFVAIPQLRSSYAATVGLAIAGLLAAGATTWLTAQQERLGTKLAARIGFPRWLEFDFQQEPSSGDVPPLEESAAVSPDSTPETAAEAVRQISEASRNWFSPGLLIPAGALIVAAVIAASVPLIAIYKNPSPATIDCVAERSAAAQLFDAHPEDQMPYKASSQLEKQCQINEFVSKLKKSS